MIHALFEHFLDNDDTYRACELYWEQSVRDIEASLDQTGEWQPWVVQHYADGTPFADQKGNPIFDARSKRFDRAFRIVQDPPVRNDLAISAWLKSYKEFEGDLPANELVISLILSEESAQLAHALLRHWMASVTSPDEMELFIQEQLPSPRV